MSPAAWSALAAAISCVVAIAALVVATQQVAIGKQQVATGEQQAKIAEAQQEAARQQLRATGWNMIAQLDTTLRQYAAERRWVNEQAKKPAGGEAGADQHDIAGYMGVFERLNELLETGPGFVSEQTAYVLYGSRLRELLKIARVRKILEQSPESPASWASFISLALKLDDYGRQNAKPVIAVQSSAAGSGTEPDRAYRTKLEAFQAKFAR